MKYVLITGGGGYIGSHICQHLKIQGYIPVILDNWSSGNKRLCKNFITYTGSIKDKSILEQIFCSYDFVSVIHMAAFSNVGESFFKPKDYYDNNVEGTKQLIQIAQSTSSLKSFIFASSCLVYHYNPSRSLNERDSLKPISPYAKTKLLCEDYILKSFQNSSISSIILRLFNVSGLNYNLKYIDFPQQENKVFFKLFSSYKENQIFFIYGNKHPTSDGFCVRDYIHIKDVVSIISSILKQCDNKRDLILNIGSGIETSVKEILKKAQILINKKITYKIVSSKNFEYPIIVSNNIKLQSLGYKINHSKIKNILLSMFNQ